MGAEIRDADARGFLAFDLRDILACLGAEVTERIWTCEGVDCTGEGVEEIFDVDYRGLAIPGARLVELAGRVLQIIDGTFYGRRPGEDTPSIVVRAVDSTLWEVFGGEECLRKIEDGFSDVRPADPDAG